MATVPTNHQRTLVEVIEAEFSFLVESSFRPTVESENSVKYVRDDGVFVRVFRDPNDKYIGLRVGLTSRPRDALTSTEIARLAGVTAPQAQYPERSDQVHASVARVAHELRVYGQRTLSGDTTIFDEAEELRRAYTRPFTREGSTGPSADRES